MLESVAKQRKKKLMFLEKNGRFSLESGDREVSSKIGSLPPKSVDLDHMSKH